MFTDKCERGQKGGILKRSNVSSSLYSKECCVVVCDRS